MPSVLLSVQVRTPEQDGDMVRALDGISAALDAMLAAKDEL